MSGIAVVASISALRQTLDELRRRGLKIGFVPTMGALHAGHARLIETAARETDAAVVSVFVNPIQFNDPQDFAAYPKTLEEDVNLCERLGAALVFAPSAAEIYPEPQQSFVEVAGVSEGLCGAFRPGHFRGVATVVLKLFNIVQPSVAYFGEKDAQQLAVIRRMVLDLNVPVEIRAVPTVREPDGLAMSSRNRHLTPEQRSIAPRLYRSLAAAARRGSGGVRDPREIQQAALAELRGSGLRVEYFEIVDPVSLQPVAQIEGPVLIAAAAWLGSTRLIDNCTAIPQAAQ